MTTPTQTNSHSIMHPLFSILENRTLLQGHHENRTESLLNETDNLATESSNTLQQVFNPDHLLTLVDDGTYINIWNFASSSIKLFKSAGYSSTLTDFFGTGTGYTLGDGLLATALFYDSHQQYEKSVDELKLFNESNNNSTIKRHKLESQVDNHSLNYKIGLSWIAVDALDLYSKWIKPLSNTSVYSLLGIASYNFASGAYENFQNLQSHYGLQQSANQLSETLKTACISLKQHQQLYPEINVTSAIERNEFYSDFTKTIADSQAPMSQVIPTAQSAMKAYSILQSSLNFHTSTKKSAPQILAATTMAMGTALYAVNSYFGPFFDQTSLVLTADIERFITDLQNEYASGIEGTATYSCEILSKSVNAHEATCNLLASGEKIDAVLFLKSVFHV